MSWRLRIWPPRPGGLAAFAALASLWAGCATPPESQVAERRAGVEARILEQGLGDDPAVRSAREELEAALAIQDTPVAIDGVDIRPAEVFEGNDKKKTEILFRLPVGNPLDVSAQRQARRAETEMALAKLEEVTLEQRVALCLPSVEYLALDERKQIYAGYARRYRALLEWNQELRGAGLLDEVRLSRFDLESRLRLATRDPSAIPSPMTLLGTDRVLDVLPALERGVAPLVDEPGLIRELVLRHQPEIGVRQASRRHFEALARSENGKRVPSLGFVDFGFEPVPSPGDPRAYEVRASILVPFGREARANQTRYEALARAEGSAERALAEDRLREAKLAVDEINGFRERSDGWLELAELADAAEKVADTWWQNRLTDPSQISSLLDSVYSTRLAVLDAREQAGLAGCSVTAATGLAVSEWH
jgi:hypothetical protein